MFKYIKEQFQLSVEVGKIQAILEVSVGVVSRKDLNQKLKSDFLNSEWASQGVWNYLPQGVGKISFTDEISVRRPVSTDATSEELSTWTVDDLDAFFSRKYGSKFRK